jgi:hypothetical protein
MGWLENMMVKYGRERAEKAAQSEGTNKECPHAKQSVAKMSDSPPRPGSVTTVTCLDCGAWRVMPGGVWQPGPER